MEIFMLHVYIMPQKRYNLERWLSGLKRLPAKQESRKRGTRVRIPLSPPGFAYPRLPAWQATPGTASSSKRISAK